MISLGHLGTGLLLISLSLSCLIICWPSNISKNYQKAFWRKSKIYCFYFSSSLPILSLVLLIYAFLTEKFLLKNIFLNSSSLLPVIYKFAACWASHEGSMLLWYSLLAALSIIYLMISRYSLKVTSLAIDLLASVQLLFGSFIILAANPFTELAFEPMEGLGLNPVLQDVALAIHPPILYIGTVSLIVPFINSLLLALVPQERAQLLEIMQKFTNFALYMLTLGIGLGAWWAYRELGWGGYWFFDPVENISLLPWISALILHHFLLLVVKDSKYFLSLICFGISAFLLVIYGNFIVRSGIITSVHSFAFSPQQGIYIFSICLILTILSLVILFLKRKNIEILTVQYTQKSVRGTIGTNNSAKILVAANLIWLISLLILIISLLYPIYCFFFADFEAAIDPEFFKRVYLPIHLPLLFLAANIFGGQNKLLIIILSLIVSLPLIIYSAASLVSGFFLLGSIYLILTLLMQLLAHWQQSARTNCKNFYSLFFGHLGFALLILSITLNNLLSREINFSGKIGQIVTEQDMYIKLENIKFADGVNYYRQIAEFSVEYNDQLISLKPENRLYKIENTLSQEADIYSYLFYDLYAILSKVEKNGIINAKFYYQPYINFIWLSALLMSLGFLLAFFNRKKL